MQYLFFQKLKAKELSKIKELINEFFYYDELFVHSKKAGATFGKKF